MRNISVSVMFLILLWTQGLCAEVACRDVSNAAEERDNIYMLLAYSVVLKDWQNSDMDHNRGYNIGSVLVDQTSKVVYWARNSVNVTKNMSQHGEVRLMNCYLANTKTKNLENHIIYTTLEPCAMCSGMMMLTSVPRTVYGQTDPSYGKAIERLDLDSSTLPQGYPPYPRHVDSEAAILGTRCKLDTLYDAYRKANQDAHITNFLASEDAKKLFTDAYNQFMNYKVKFPENQPVLDRAQSYYKTVLDTYQPTCPSQ